MEELFGVINWFNKLMNKTSLNLINSISANPSIKRNKLNTALNFVKKFF